MTDIERDMADILETARWAHEPHPSDVHRVGLALAATVGGFGATTASSSAAASKLGGGGSTFPAVAGGAGFAKLVAIGLLLGGAGWLVNSVATRPPTAPSAAETAASRPRELEVIQPLASSIPPVELQRVARVTKVSESPTLPVAPPRAGATVGASKAKPVVSAAPRDSLAEQVLALRRAQHSLESDPERALLQLDTMDVRHPQGALREEVLVARVLAYCKAGRTSEAQAAAKGFFTAYPTSVHAPRVRATCVTTSNGN